MSEINRISIATRSQEHSVQLQTLTI